MDYTRLNKQSIILSFANEIAARIIKKSIKKLQRITIILSGDDSGLVNSWDEICVQIQGEYSFDWEAYEFMIDNHLKEETKKLTTHEQFAIWLQTDNGVYYDEEEDENPEFIEEDILQYLKIVLLKEAGSWSNDRIRRYLN
ncbi:hypothetical protein [Mongoliitalea daihaiensis]|uniref:hypothetical protein n=1 Tax=Mongoliitalea daihaiensis TaxID=2782006 RepID=UPI001F162B69|nr:hypothetical protein [Mongoliitalea daihaiensis]UJP63507.1 hypothetical protein IPZ59_11700 [Mongoliitalea daihaiensis]